MRSLPSSRLLPWLGVLLLVAGLSGPAMAAPDPTPAPLATPGVATAPPATPAPGVGDDKAQTIVHMLDYVAVDYPEFVKDGQVLNPGEYQEQHEFATQAVALLAHLPPVPEQPALLAQAQHLEIRIEAKAPGAEVSDLASQLRAGVIQAWRLSVAPRQAPAPGRGAALYAANCVACHGAQGYGDGPLARAMQPVPRNFHDEARLRQLSVYGMYSTLTLGVGGTPMRAFTELSDADRWALAFHVAALRATPEQLARGEKLWRQGVGQGTFPDLKALVTTAPERIGPAGSDLDAVRAYLTHQPQAVKTAAPAPLAYARAQLDAAAATYAGGDHEGARQQAIAAYLEGFELVESALDNVDAPLRAQIEREMMQVRTDIGAGQPPAAVATQVARTKALLDRADQALSGEGLSPTAAFVSALLILLREGLEAILVLSAITAFVVKTNRRDALPYIHAGWIGALALGAVTWAVARYVVGISGASRELTEGVTALVAAAMLLYVGWWLHSRSTAQAWNKFIRQQINAALGKKTLWAMAGISFLAVYRELFEVVLFYETLWEQAGPAGTGAVLWGILAGACGLLLVGGAILRYSVRLPIGPFFTVASVFLAIMALVFVGNGVKALQEAGVINALRVHFVSVPLLGIHPTLQGLGAQLATLALILGGMWANREQKVAGPARPASPVAGSVVGPVGVPVVGAGVSGQPSA